MINYQLLYLFTSLMASIRELGEGVQKNTDMLLSYLLTSNYLQYLRQHYRHFLHLQNDEKNTLVRNAELFRVKDDHTPMIINYNQPTLSIVVYGEIKVNDKQYSKGTYFRTNIEKIEVNFIKKSVVMMLNENQVEQIMKEYQLFYTKKMIIQKTMPVELLNFQRREYRILCAQAKMVQNTSKSPFRLAYLQEEGVYMLYSGTFALINQDKIKIAQIFNDNYGVQYLWDQTPKYHLQPITFDHKYLWIPKSVFLQVLSQQHLSRIKENHEKRQKYREKMEKHCQAIQKGAAQYIRSKLVNKRETLQQYFECNQRYAKDLKQRFSKCEQEQFHQMLGQMEQKTYKPRWKRQQEHIQTEKQKLNKKKRLKPKKSKSTYFSTLKDNKQILSEFHSVFHKSENNPFSLKLHLEERVPSKRYYQRKNQTQPVETIQRNPQNLQKLFHTTSFSYYSHNYDRSYSMGMTSLSKMRHYDHLKKESTLKRGEKILSNQEMTAALSTSFGQLSSTLACKNYKYRSNPQDLFHKTIKRNKILAKRIMQSRGATTWR